MGRGRGVICFPKDGSDVERKDAGRLAGDCKGHKVHG